MQALSLEPTASASTPPPALSLTALPDEVLSCICTLMPLTSLATLAATCHRLAAAADDDELVWKEHCCRELRISPAASTAQDGCTWQSMLRAYTQPLSDGLHTTAQNLVLDGLDAKFQGHLGRDRAVVANQPIPTSPKCTFVCTTASPAAAMAGGGHTTGSDVPRVGSSGSGGGGGGGGGSSSGSSRRRRNAVRRRAARLARRLRRSSG